MHRYNYNIMNKTTEFLKKYNSIVVFSNYRTGSTALCNILANFIQQQNTPVFLWMEYLLNNLYLTEKYGGLQVDAMKSGSFAYGPGNIYVAKRPVPYHIVQSTLKFFNKARLNNFVIFKVMPDDFLNGNDKLLMDYILKDDTIFKIGLNREDTYNTIISSVEAALTNQHHIIKDQPIAKSDIIQQIVPSHIINRTVDNIIQHHTWLFYNHFLLNQIIWYDELSNLSISDLGLHHFAETMFLKNTADHSTRATTHFLNSDEFLKCASVLHNEILPLVENVRSVSTNKHMWRY